MARLLRWAGVETTTMLSRLLVDISPLRGSKQFRLLFYTQAAAGVGSQIALVAVPVQVFQITHSSLAVGGLGLAELFPLLAFAITGGAIADAMDRRNLLRMVYAARTLIAGLFLVNALLPSPSLIALYVLTAAGIGLVSLGSPASNAALPRLVPPNQLVPAQAVMNLYFNVTAVAGPAVGGLLVATFGVQAAYVAAMVSFVLAIVILSRLMPLPPDEGAPRANMRAILDGLAYVRTQPAVLGCFLVDTNAMVFGMSTAVFPAFAVVFGGGARTVGLLFAAPSFGALIASATSGWMRQIRRQGRAINVCVILWGIAIVLYGLANNLAVALFFLALAGGADAISAIFRSTILLQASPDAMRGRMSGVQYAQVASAPTLGDFEAGLVASLTNVRVSVVSGGAACIAGVFLLAAFLPALDRYLAPTDPAAGTLSPPPSPAPAGEGV
jgi:MFS family permease